MSMEPSDTELDELPPLGDGAESPAEGAEDEPMGPEGEEGPTGIMEMLRSTEPPVNPADVGRELDIEAEWWEHLACGFIKASGSRGTEAWMHGVMAVIILAMSMQEGDETDTAGGGRGSQHDEYHHADAGEPDDSLPDDTGYSAGDLVG